MTRSELWFICLFGLLVYLVYLFIWFIGLFGLLVYLVYWFIWFIGLFGLFGLLVYLVYLVYWFIWFIWFIGLFVDLVYLVYLFIWFIGLFGFFGVCVRAERHRCVSVNDARRDLEVEVVVELFLLPFWEEETITRTDVNHTPRAPHSHRLPVH